MRLGPQYCWEPVKRDRCLMVTLVGGGLLSRMRCSPSLPSRHHLTSQVHFTAFASSLLPSDHVWRHCPPAHAPALHLPSSHCPSLPHTRQRGWPGTSTAAPGRGLGGGRELLCVWWGDRGNRENGDLHRSWGLTAFAWLISLLLRIILTCSQLKVEA